MSRAQEREGPGLPTAGGDPTPGAVVTRMLPGDPELAYHLYLPRAGGCDARLFVTVHGLSEQASLHAERLSPAAERHGVVLVAPHFSRDVFPDYQRLGRAGLGARADEALHRLIEEVARLTGAARGRVYLFGYSGGGQFVHRYLMAHPARVVAAAVASAGWYTFPDPHRRYPLGIQTSRRLPGVGFDPDAFLRVPVLLTVGDRDVQRDAALRKRPVIDRQQGRNRVERAERWAEAMERTAHERQLPSPITFRKLRGADHSFEHCIEDGGLDRIVLDYLFAPGLGISRQEP